MADRYNTDGKLTLAPDDGLLVRFEDLERTEANVVAMAAERDRVAADLRLVQGQLEQAAETDNELRAQVKALEDLRDLLRHDGDELRADAAAARVQVSELEQRAFAAEQRVEFLERGIILAQEGLAAVLPPPEPTPAETLLEQIAAIAGARKPTRT